MSKLEFFTTKDGSPTAAFQTFAQEKMHHMGGAFGETIYIYGPALQWGYAKVPAPRILSLGTGIAYNEILASAFSIVFDAPFIGASYEANIDLNAALISWIKGGNEGVVPFSIYNRVLEMTAETFEIDANDIKVKMQKSYEVGTWKINGAWDGSDKTPYNVVIYDFFSSKAMENFWSADFLNEFVKTNTDAQCSFATYACTGNLKRALRQSGFKVYKRKGYAWKLNSTFAARTVIEIN